MRSVRTGLAMLLAAVVASALPGSALAGQSREQADAALDRALRAVVERPNGPPGVSAVVHRGREREFLAQGVADVRDRRPMRISDRMRIASTTKAFAGAVALRLVDAGRLSLDDTIAERVPGLPAAWGPITLRQLMQHTSGLPNYTQSAGLRAHLSTRPRGYVTPRQIVDWVRNTPLQFPPGSDYAYSNTDNIVVGLMIEAETGASFESQLGGRVLGPLGLANTNLPSTWLMPGPYVRGYDPLGDGRYANVSEAINSSAVWAAGGMVSTPADLDAFARGYAGPRLLSAPTRRAQRRFVRGSSEPVGPGRNDAGLSIFRYRTSCGTVYGHTGNFPGYTQFFAATANGRRSIVVSANEQLDRAPTSNPEVFPYLRRAFSRGVCAALAD